MSTRQRSRLVTTTFFFHVLFLSASVCSAAVTNTWTGSTDTDWFTAGNWSEGVVPTNNHDVLITNVANSVLLTNSTANLASFTITNETLTFTNWTTTLNASNVTIRGGGIFTLPGAFTNNAMSNRVHIVCTNFALEIGGTINANKKGYLGGALQSSGSGPGGGNTSGNVGCGGGYGGKGGNNYQGTAGGATYGSVNAPVAPGSGGGGGSTASGSSGGGAVRIEATGVVTVYGAITANGEDGTGYGAGGSGGGIFITCERFNGDTNGILSANGGKAAQTTYGSGGGGGRIAVIYNGTAQTNQPGVRFSTTPGKGSGTPYPGENGTVYLPDTALLPEVLPNQFLMDVTLFGITNWSSGNLTVSNCGVTFGEEAFRLNVTNDVFFGGGASVTWSANSRLSCGGNMTMNGGTATLGRVSAGTNVALSCGGNMILTNGGSLYVYSGMTNGLGVDYGGLVSVTGDVHISSSSWIYPYSHQTNGASVLLRMRNLTISTNAGINADGKGYQAWYGQGKGAYDNDYGGTGGGYGGKGCDIGVTSGGGTYGSTNAPLDPGSSGGSYGIQRGGSGGGLVRIEACGAVTVDGTITAGGTNGTTGNGGGGSGGAIFINCKAFEGGASGTLSANGGNKDSSTSAGGGGGRIAVWYAVPENRWQGIRDGSDMRRVSIITNASDYTKFAGTVSLTNGIGGTNGMSGTCIFLTVTPPSGTMFMAW